jgi:hypothetical protein
VDPLDPVGGINVNHRPGTTAESIPDCRQLALIATAMTAHSKMQPN